MPKATKRTVRRRTEEVLRVRLGGAEHWDLREYVREKEKEPGSAWELKEDEKSLSDSQLWRYVKLADDAIRDAFRKDSTTARLRRRHLAQRRNLYAKAVAQGDIRTALSCLDSEAKMLGLDDELQRLQKKLEKEVEELRKLIPGTEKMDAKNQKH